MRPIQSPGYRRVARTSYQVSGVLPSANAHMRCTRFAPTDAANLDASSFTTAVTALRSTGCSSSRGRPVGADMDRVSLNYGSRRLFQSLREISVDAGFELMPSDQIT